MMKRYVGILAATTLMLVATTARAQLVEFNLTGTVTTSYGTPFGLSIPLGTAVTGTLAWDPSLPPTASGTNYASYLQSAPSGMTVEVLGNQLESVGTGSYLVLNDNFGVDGITGYFSSVTVNSQPISGAMNFGLYDYSQTVFSSTVLPSDLNVEDFDRLNGGLFGSVETGGGTVFFQIDSIVRSAIDVAIDIKPSYVATQSEGKIPVVILTTAEFDAMTVDPASVRFGVAGTEAAPTSYQPIAEGLLLLFDVQDLALVCTTTELKLTGSTTAGNSIKGSGPVQITGC